MAAVSPRRTSAKIGLPACSARNNPSFEINQNFMRYRGVYGNKLLYTTNSRNRRTEELVCGFNDTNLRIAVEEKAKAFGCAEAISNLAIIDAVRFLQHRERCTPCFGWES